MQSPVLIHAVVLPLNQEDTFVSRIKARFRFHGRLIHNMYLSAPTS
jgi:hypothetical protein